MKPISIQFDESEYLELKSLAARTGRPVAELIQEALGDYLEHRRGRRGSLFDVPVHHGGAQLKTWARDEVFDEIIDK
jgi:sarcosine oxidase delta subunit